MHPSGWQWRRSVESPWFYIAWFSFFGAVVLFVAQEKYGQRQAGIERKFQARSRAATQAPQGEVDTPDAQSVLARYSSPDDTVIPLWPLGVLLGMLAMLSALFAYRAGRRPGAGRAEWRNKGAGEQEGRGEGERQNGIARL